jgi:ribA/ribD-fused uncharacterized protein
MSIDFSQHGITIRENYALFWGGVFSNWYKSKFEVKGVYFNCVEQFMMACKALQFNDHETLELIMKSNDPSAQKAYGRKIRNYDDTIWKQIRYPVVREGVFAKFDQNPHLQTVLLNTDPFIIVESSPKDIIWGVGLAADHKDVTNPGMWKGTNLLGMALMDVRATLLKMQED